MPASLILSLPARSPRPAGMVRDDPRRLAEWLLRLHRLDPRSRLKALSEMLWTLNRVPLRTRRRMRLLESCRPVLSAALSDHDAGIPGAERVAAAMEYAFGIKTVVAELFARDSGLGAARNAQALQRSLWALGLVARESMVAAADSPPRLWREAHSLYECAVRTGVAERSIEDPLSEPVPASRPSLEYRRAVLLGLCAGALGNIEDVGETWWFLGRVASLARLRPVAERPANTCCFWIDAELESPARYRPDMGSDAQESDSSSPDRVLELDAGRLVRFLANKLDNAAEAERRDGIVAAPPRVAHRLIECWSGGAGAPSESRSARDLDMPLTPSHSTRASTSVATVAPPPAAPTGIVRLRRTDRRPRAAVDAPSEASVRHDPGSPTPPPPPAPRSTMDVPRGVASTRPGTGPQTRSPPVIESTHWLTAGLKPVLAALEGADPSHPEGLGCRLRDQRQHGARIVLGADQASDLRLGSVVLCRPSENRRELWLGIVRRRTMADDGTVELGTQILTRRPRLAWLDTGRTDRREPALLIDGNPDTGRLPTLIAAPALLTMGQEFEAAVSSNHRIRLQATEVLEDNNEIQWLSCRRLPRRRPPSDQDTV